MRDIAGRAGLSKSSPDRHKSHFSATLVKAAEANDLAHGGKLLEQVQGLVEKALESLERAEGKGNEREVKGAIREARRSVSPRYYTCQVSQGIGVFVTCGFNKTVTSKSRSYLVYWRVDGKISGPRITKGSRF